MFFNYCRALLFAFCIGGTMQAQNYASHSAKSLLKYAEHIKKCTLLVPIHNEYGYERELIKAISAGWKLTPVKYIRYDEIDDYDPNFQSLGKNHAVSLGSAKHEGNYALLQRDFISIYNNRKFAGYRNDYNLSCNYEGGKGWRGGHAVYLKFSLPTVIEDKELVSKDYSAFFQEMIGYFEGQVNYIIAQNGEKPKTKKLNGVTYYANPEDALKGRTILMSNKEYFAYISTFKKKKRPSLSRFKADKAKSLNIDPDKLMLVFDEDIALAAKKKDPNVALLIDNTYYDPATGQVLAGSKQKTGGSNGYLIAVTSIAGLFFIIGLISLI